MLFSRFAAAYGVVWRGPLKDTVFLKFAKKEWGDALAPFSDVIIDEAIEQCRSFYDLPPTLPQFLKCCRQIKKQTSFYVVKKETVPVNRELAKSCLRTIMSNLKK